MKSHLGAVDPKQNKTKVSLLLWPLCWHPPQTPATAMHLCWALTATSEVCVVLTCLRVSCHQQTWGQCLTPVTALPLCRFSGLSWLLNRAGENYDCHPWLIESKPLFAPGLWPTAWHILLLLLLFTTFEVKLPALLGVRPLPTVNCYVIMGMVRPSELRNNQKTLLASTLFVKESF